MRGLKRPRYLSAVGDGAQWVLGDGFWFWGGGCVDC